jgi:raffinose/stachyose/melibiose transport system permease protein
LGVALCLLASTTQTIRAQSAQPVTIEVPLFEGGAGKDWYIYSARSYELNGKWTITAPSDPQFKATLDVGVAPKGKERQPQVMLATLTLPGTSPTEAIIVANKVSKEKDYDRLWTWKDSLGRELRIATDERGVLSGWFKNGAAREHGIVGHKPNPVHVNMYLDPRITDKVRVRLLEGTFFEISNAFINWWPLIKNGDVLALNDALAKPNWEGDSTWRDSFLPGSLDQYRDKDGKIYGVPQAYYAYVFWYNKKIFREHKWKTPRTWNELFDLCAEMKKQKIAPVAFQGRYPGYAQPIYDAAYLHLAGMKRWEEKSDLVPGTINSEEGIEAINIVRRLQTECFEQGAMGMSHTESQQGFFLGRTAMIACGAWLKSEMLGKIPDGFELGAFNLPTVENDKADPTAVQVRVEPYFVMSKSKHPEVAVDFLRFQSCRQMSGAFARMQDLPSAVKGANEGNLSKDLDDLVKIVNTAKTTYGTIPGEGYPEMAQVYRDEMYKALVGPGTPKEVAENFEQLAQSVRNRAENPDKVRVLHPWKALLLIALLVGGAIFAFAGAAKGLKNAGPRVAQLQRMGWGNVLLFVAPSVAIYSLFVIYPSLRAFVWSTHEWNGLTNMHSMPFKGLLNFKRLLLESDSFWTALGNNLFLMFVIPIFVIPLALFLSACLSRGVFGAKVFRVVFFFPNLLGSVAATLLWLHVYNPQGGLMNAALVALGFKSFQGFAWLEPSHLYWSLVPISIWGACGFNMILYLAAMESIPEEYYEAARMDGAGPLRQFFTITIPLIWDILAISVVFLVIGGMKAFDVIWLLANQQPVTSNHVIATRMIETMFDEFKVGEATAIAVLLFLMVFIGTAATMKAMRRETVEM